MANTESDLSTVSPFPLLRWMGRAALVGVLAGTAVGVIALLS